jgi:flagellar hook-associated protein 2
LRWITVSASYGAHDVRWPSVTIKAEIAMSSTISSGGSATTQSLDTSAAQTAAAGITQGTVTSQGLASGLNVSSIVSQLVTAYAQPAKAQITRESQQLAAKTAALTQLQGAMTTLQTAVKTLEDPNALSLKTTSSSAATFVTASATGSVPAGNYSVTVAQLAQAQQLTSAVVTGGANATIGTGTLTLTSGSSSFNVAVTAGNNSLTDIAQAINGASGNPGITATVLNGTSGAYLMVTGANTGAANAITVSATGGDGGLSQLTYPATGSGGMSVVTPAQDALLTVNGVAVDSPSNTVTSAINGLTLNLLQAQPASTTTPATPLTPMTVSVSNDTTDITTAVQGFVTTYNALADTLTSLTGYTASTSTAGGLEGDPIANNITTQLQHTISNNVAGLSPPYNNLTALGITMNSAGDMSVNTAELQAALAVNPSAAANVLGGTNGIATQLDNFVQGHLGITGDITEQNLSMATQQASITAQTNELNARMAIVQANYTAQFTALDTLLAKMQSTSSFLTQQLSASGNAITTNSSSNSSLA